MCMYFIVTFISIIALFCVMIKNKKNYKYRDQIEKRSVK